jgi:small-conductance mechanosensitive channel
VGNAEGFVKRISVRSTQIQTFDRTDVIVPNSDLISQPVINWTRGSLQGRIIVPVSVAYGTDSRRVTDILMEIAEDQPIVLIDPPPAIMFTGFGADGLDFEIRAILSDINQGLGVATEIRHQIAERFAQEGIEIPYAHRVITISNVDELAKLTSRSGPRRAERTVNSGADRSSVPEAQDDALDPRIARSSASGMEGTGQSDGDGDGDGGIS